MNGYLKVKNLFYVLCSIITAYCSAPAPLYALGAEPAEEGETYGTKQLLIETDDPAELAEQPEVTEIHSLGDGLYTAEYTSPAATEEAYDALSAREDVEVHPDYRVRASSVSAGQVAWGVAATGLDLYQSTLDATSVNTVKVAVLDTGIYAAHEAFFASAARDRLDTSLSRNYIDSNSDVSDNNGHGTMVAGIIAEATSKNVKIVPVKVLDDSGEGSLLTVLTAVANLYQNVDVINLSLGINKSAISAGDLAVYERVLARAYDAGVVITAAVGNGRSASVDYPASSGYVLAASSVSQNKAFSSSFSNYGSAVDFALPGENLTVPTKTGGYTVKSGTSFSSPFLASAAAMVASEFPSYSYASRFNILKNNAEDLGHSGKDVYYGYGRLDFNLARFAAEPDPQPLKDGIYTISSALSPLKVLDISGASASSGANLQLYASNNTPAQKFVLTYLGDGYYQIENLKSTRVLDVAGGSSRSGANVQQWASNNTNAQKWRLRATSDGYFSLVSGISGLFLDVAGASTANGANLQVYSGNGTKAQKFRFNAIEEFPDTAVSGTHTIKSTIDSAKVLDIAGGSKSSGGNLQIYQMNGTAAQQFDIQPLGNGFYRIVNVGSGKVLDVSAGVCNNGTNVQQWAWNGTIAQQWLVQEHDDGKVSLVSRCNALRLDVSGGRSSSGTNVQIWNKSNVPAQLYTLD